MLKFFILFLCILHTICGNYFCDFPCKEKHTVCKRQYCSLSEACGPFAKAVMLTDNNRRWIVDVHNRIRNTVALGGILATNGSSSNMHALSYDKEIEFVAQCWANACREGGEAHDRCRSTKKFLEIGQNLFTISDLDYQDFKNNKFLSKAVLGWFWEVELTDPNEFNSYERNPDTVHFTQLIWAKTTLMGCGRTVLQSNDGNNTLYIYCNYGIAGNLRGESVFERGVPCSKCESESNTICNTRYPGLCGEIELLSADTWELPSRFTRKKVSSAISILQRSFSTFIISIGIFVLEWRLFL